MTLKKKKVQRVDKFLKGIIKFGDLLKQNHSGLNIRRDKMSTRAGGRALMNEWHSPPIVSLQPKSHSTLLGFFPYEEKLWAG